METYFAVTAPGLERITAEELNRLGMKVSKKPPADVPRLSAEESGGVEFEGSRADLYRANYQLRTASRVLVRMDTFYAAAFSELRKKASRLGWENFLKPGDPVTLHVTCHKSKLYHSGAVAERVLGAIGDKLGKLSVQKKAEETADGHPPQLVVVRLVNDQCTISIDSSGELLHRRGYRLETAKAPLRETLAAGMLLASGWDAQSPLLDPFCGSGTIAIEAALLARGVPPGHNRWFAFMDWPRFDQTRWQSSLSAWTASPPDVMPRIQASDRDAGAIRIAQANAERAGVAEWIEFSCRAISAIEPPPEPGWVVTNPPYGIRVSANKDLRNLYAQFGNVLRAHCPGWKLAILCSDLQLLGQIGLPLDSSFSLINGGVNVRLARGKVA
jgi:putative N6-adenine-specific DNA methylase